MNTKFKWIMSFLVFVLLGISSIVGHTAVFSIVPKAGTVLPTQVTIGSSVKALYTVTNTTGSLHVGNFVKYVPLNTTQVTVDGAYPDLCGATFQLASNASCTLELNVTGPVNANDPNPRHHLFACLGGCVTCCAGTNYALNVTAKNPVFTRYTAVFDAGSSGTRLSFYKVALGHGGYPIIEKIITINDKTSGVPADNGINDFLNGKGTITLSSGETLPVDCPGTSDLGKQDVGPCVLQPRLVKLDDEIAALNRSNPGLNLTKDRVIVELFATAGMRTEDTRNGGAFTTAAILQYYTEMKEYVSLRGYGVDEFKTINGNSEEGVWTWINLNDYYYNSFGGNTTVSQSVQYPVGDFEVGGSSMQIAFPTNTSPSGEGNVYLVTINGFTFNVYSKTFLGLGGDDSRKYVKAFGYDLNTGGKNCYAASATVANTTETSGIQLYPSTQVTPPNTYPFPENTNIMTPWTTVTPVQLLLQVPPFYNSTTCSGMYDTIDAQVTSLPRNNYGTDNEGGIVTLSSFKSDLQTSKAPFVGTDNFFFSSKEVKYTPSTGFNPTIFQEKLESFCNGTVPVKDDKFMQNACPNGNFMNTYLFGTNGLFTGSSATFAGVVDPNAGNNPVLTWTRGYLLSKYAN